MLIKGLQKLTLLDYPDRLACTVFIGGCNFRCPFCHNASLVLPEKFGDTIEACELMEFLKTRVGRLDGVCISGGEPTLMPDLPELIEEIKALGCLVKLDTNGSNPRMLSELIDRGLLDYVAMDIKSSPDGYPKLIGTDSPTLIEAVKESVDILRGGMVDYELRTTLVDQLHSEEDMHMIGRWLPENAKYFLQSYRDEGDLIVGGFSAPDEAKMQKYLKIVKNYLPNSHIRG